MAFRFATAAAMPKPCLSIRANQSSSLDVSDLADDHVSRSKKNFVFIINPKGFSFFSSLFSSSISSLLRFFTLSLNLGWIQVLMAGQARNGRSCCLIYALGSVGTATWARFLRIMPLFMPLFGCWNTSLRPCWWSLSCDLFCPLCYFIGSFCFLF